MDIFTRLQPQMPSGSLQQLQSIDQFWLNYRQGKMAIAEVIQVNQNSENGIAREQDFDVIVCGGTLGIFIASALQIRGWRVLVLEQGKLRGREQEWNISRQELAVFLELGLLTEAELEQAIATVYNPARVGFGGGAELWVRDILNIGIDPVYLLAALKQKFLDAGGILLEEHRFQNAQISAKSVTVTCENRTNGQSLMISGRLLLDVMGHFSPIARQGRSLTQSSLKPDGVCMVVGSCAKGMPDRDYGDLIYSFTPIQNQCQYFWEAFPAKDGRTTYMFTYVDAEPERPSFAQLMEDYLTYLSPYQCVDLTQLEFVRLLFGFFPSYVRNPLRSAWDRVLHVGDSSGMQSPLSFGGFGAMVRHLPRLADGIDAALRGDWLTKGDLRSLQPYQPNLSVTWLFQKSMSVPIQQKLDRDRINYLLNVTFASMEKLGDHVLYPFLQDVVQFQPLAQTMIAMAIADPVLVIKIIGQVGALPLLDWFRHYLALAGYSLLHRFGSQIQPAIGNLLPEQQHRWQCQMAAWKYGSGQDFQASAPKT
ncbi:MAG: FAD-binding oxidoreductase [Pseudanabaenaceae cyanobacterium bins.39]|nr:FAD-binding oxidoreductase [Pseudanabaenaceae cyanobacterium bins.39]